MAEYPSKPRVLILGGKLAGQHPVADALRQMFTVDEIQKHDDAMEALRTEAYHGIFADVGDFLPLERSLVGEKASLVLNTIGEGVCIVDTDGRTVWSNRRMQEFPADVGQQVKQICLRALTLFCDHTGALSSSSRTRTRKFTFQSEDHYFELVASPLGEDPDDIKQVVAVVWDATSGRRLQQKLDAIDAAGRELTRLENDAVVKLSPNARLQLLQDKIIRYSKDLMNFDHFAIRLLDKRTNKLEPVIAEGLPEEALEIDLYAQPEGNGISGYVATTGRSYICHDIEKDPRYVLGLAHCKSSLTVPLALHDKVIGVLNVESEKIGAFDEDDRQIAEIFGRYVALALHILDLLVVERYTTSGQMADNVVQEVAQPLNDIVTEAQTMIEEYIGDDSMRQRLHTVVDHVETIRTALRDVKQGPRGILGKDQAAQNKADPMIADKHILIADDEQNIRQTIGEVLEKQGAKCVLCKNGFEAVARLEQQDFDLVLSDIKMPYRNGYEIFAAAKRQNENLPVILMTGFGYDPHHSIVRASREGLSSVMFKPFKVDQLLEEVRKGLSYHAAQAGDPGEPGDPAEQAQGRADQAGQTETQADSDAGADASPDASDSASNPPADRSSN